MNGAVLVTGATTPLGERLVRRLASDPDIEHVIAVGLEPPTSMPLSSPRLSYLQVDLTEERAVHGLLYGPAREHRVHAILHAAQHRSAHRGGRRVHQLNVATTRVLLRLAERHPTVRRFIFRSHGEVYRVRRGSPDLIEEGEPLNLDRRAPQWIRDRVEADLTVCSRMAMTRMRILVLRCAEILAPSMGSQLYDYLGSRVCFRPLGYDPMVNLLTLEDAVEALRLAVHSGDQGIFNVPGKDTLPLSEVVRRWGRSCLPTPGWLLGPLYRLRAAAIGKDFRYDVNYWRLHYSGILDGRRARDMLLYEPRHPIHWPAAI